jgi:hypothetical protein
VLIGLLLTSTRISVQPKYKEQLFDRHYTTKCYKISDIDNQRGKNRYFCEHVQKCKGA